MAKRIQSTGEADPRELFDFVWSLQTGQLARRRPLPESDIPSEDAAEALLTSRLSLSPRDATGRKAPHRAAAPRRHPQA